MPTKKPFKLNMTAGRLGLITFDMPLREVRSLENALNKAIEKALVEAEIEHVAAPNLPKVVRPIYDALCKNDTFLIAGFGDTEGRYGMCDAVVRYLAERGREELAEDLSNVDFLLFA